MVPWLEELVAQRIRIEHDGREINVMAEKIAGKLWFHLDGVTHVYEPMAAKKEAKAAQTSDRIEAPMPGKILRVEANVGDMVKAGQVVVVMEAMKMEYTLAATHATEIKEVGCKVGEQVRVGQILVRFKDA